MKCGRTVTCGAGFVHVCDRREGHAGLHVAHSRLRGERRESLRWSHERDGCAVFADAPGAVDVTRRIR